MAFSRSTRLFLFFKIATRWFTCPGHISHTLRVTCCVPNPVLTLTQDPYVAVTVVIVVPVVLPRPTSPVKVVIVVVIVIVVLIVVVIVVDKVAVVVTSVLSVPASSSSGCPGTGPTIRCCPSF